MSSPNTARTAWAIPPMRSDRRRDGSPRRPRCSRDGAVHAPEADETERATSDPRGSEPAAGRPIYFRRWRRLAEVRRASPACEGNPIYARPNVPKRSRNAVRVSALPQVGPAPKKPTPGGQPARAPILYRKLQRTSGADAARARDRIALPVAGDPLKGPAKVAAAGRRPRLRSGRCGRNRGILASAAGCAVLHRRQQCCAVEDRPGRSHTRSILLAEPRCSRAHCQNDLQSDVGTAPDASYEQLCTSAQTVSGPRDRIAIRRLIAATTICSSSLAPPSC